MTFPQLPSPPPMVKSFLLGLSGAMIAYLGQWLTATDFGVFTPLVAAFTPVLINYLTRLRQGKGNDDGGDDDTPSGGVVPNPTPSPADPLGIDALLKQLFPPAPTKSFAAMGVVELDRSAVMITPKGVCMMAQSQPTSAGVKWLPTGLLALLLCLMATGCQDSFGRPPRAVISGPTRGEPGEFLEFSARSSEGKPHHVRWTISPELKGRKQLSSPEAVDITAAGYPGTYILTLSVSNEFGVDTTARQYVVDGEQPLPPPAPQPVKPDPVPPSPTPTPGPAPQPAPVPQPDPPVPPPAPVKSFGVAEKLVAAIRTIQVADRVATSQRLSAEAKAVAEAIKNKTITSPTAILTRALIPVSQLPAVWQPAKDVLKTEITRLAGDKQLVTADDYEGLFREIAAALASIT